MRSRRNCIASSRTEQMATWGVAIFVLLAGCSDDETRPDASPAEDAEVADSSPDDAVAADGDEDGAGDAVEEDTDHADAGPQAPRLEKSLPPTSELGSRREYRIARGIIHSHTVLSHDACDGSPKNDEGGWNESCLEDWRRGVCKTRQDYVMNTDHEEFAARAPFEELLLQRGDDELVEEEGSPVANRMKCDNGFEPLVLPGGEFGTMPVGLKRHLDISPDEREDAYSETTEARVDSLRQLGAVVLQAHVESKPLEELRPLGLDGFEIYNLHSNIAPDIREEYLGLDPTGHAEALTDFTHETGPAPDLAMLGFFARNEPALRKFDTLLAEGQQLVGISATDSHRNAIDLELRDGERVDSFRRMMRFFSNHLLVEEITHESLRQALRNGRAYTAFEYLGTPVGFDYFAKSGADTAEMGETVALADDPTLRVEAPSVYGFDGEVSPEIDLLRAEEGGAEQVATSGEDLSFQPDEPGAYRVVVRVDPTYLRPYLQPTPEDYLGEQRVWVYGNPIYVE